MQPQISVRQINIPDTSTVLNANFQTPRAYINISRTYAWKGKIIHIKRGRQTEREKGPVGRLKVDVRIKSNGT
jgi:hypothetical protein